MLDVRWSALILVTVFGLRKSTAVVGLLQSWLWSTFWKSSRIWKLKRSLNGMFF